MMIDPAKLKYDDHGLIPVVVQDVASGAVLMVAWANEDAVRRTVESGDGWFWSRSRRELWRKGETSGHVLQVDDVAADCDADTLLYRVHPVGPTCHRGTRTCFDAVGIDAVGIDAVGIDSETFDNPARLELGWLRAILDQRKAAGDVDSSYTARLLAAGTARIAQKVAEEGAETAIAAVVHSHQNDESSRDEVVGEAADLLYHLSVLLLDRGIDPGEVAERLAERHRSRKS